MAEVDKAIDNALGRVRRLILVTFSINLTAGILFQVLRLLYDPRLHGSSPPGATQNQEIHMSGPSAEESPASRKTWLTTAEVAARENLAERTIVQYIADRRIDPAPDRAARAWIIPADYRILPPSAAISRWSPSP